MLVHFRFLSFFWLSKYIYKIYLFKVYIYLKASWLKPFEGNSAKVFLFLPFLFFLTMNNQIFLPLRAAALVLGLGLISADPIVLYDQIEISRNKLKADKLNREMPHVT